ncbi:hypothetical protein ACFGVR_13570 [Mucilaginibacter sp. AW1-3]
MRTIDDVKKMLQGQWYWVDNLGHSNASKTFFVKGDQIINVVGFGNVTSASLSVGPAGDDDFYWPIQVPEFGWHQVMKIDDFGMTVVLAFFDNKVINFTHTPPDKPAKPKPPARIYK